MNNAGEGEILPDIFADITFLRKRTGWKA